MKWWAHLDSIRSRGATEDSERPKGAKLSEEQSDEDTERPQGAKVTRDQRMMSPTQRFVVAGVLRNTFVLDVYASADLASRACEEATLF